MNPVAGAIIIMTFLPATAIEEKGAISDKLRSAAELGGCETPTVEVEVNDVKQLLEVTVRCRKWKVGNPSKE